MLPPNIYSDIAVLKMAFDSEGLRLLEFLFLIASWDDECNTAKYTVDKNGNAACGGDLQVNAGLFP